MEVHPDFAMQNRESVGVESARFYALPDRAEGMKGPPPVRGFQESLVDMVILDNEADRLGIVQTVLRIYIEGAEQPLRSCRPRICPNLHPEAVSSQGGSSDDGPAWLSKLGYRHKVVNVDHEVHVIAIAE